MSKRAIPLLYIHQPKEVETEADNQEYFYRKKIVMKQNAFEKRTDEMGKELKTKHDEDIKNEQDTPNENKKEEEVIQHTNEKDEILAKLTYIQSLPSGIVPKIEVEIEDQKYIAILEEKENETVVFRTRTAPYKVECSINQIASMKIISL